MNRPMNHPTSEEEDGATASDRYSNCVLGSFIDNRNFGFDQVQSYIWENWGQHQHAWVVSMEHNFFVIKFSSVEYLLAILHNGPFSVDGGLFVLRRWEPGLEPVRNLRITEILVWIRLTGLPMEFINPVAGPKLASMIGEVEEDRTGIFGPHNVRSLSYLSARVWINPADPLMPGFYVRLPGARGSLIWVDCWYERIRNYCRRCGKIGHPMDCCPIQDNVALESYLDEHFQRLVMKEGRRCFVIALRNCILVQAETLDASWVGAQHAFPQVTLRRVSAISCLLMQDVSLMASAVLCFSNILLQKAILTFSQRWMAEKYHTGTIILGILDRSGGISGSMAELWTMQGM